MNQIYSKEEKVLFRHVDFAGIVFYPRFLEMLNDLVENWFEESLDRPFSKIHETHGIPTVDLKVKFKRPARIGDLLIKELWVNELGAASLTCGFRFVNQNETCLEGEVTLVNVALNKAAGRIASEPFDDQTRNQILPFTKKPEIE